MKLKEAILFVLLLLAGLITFSCDKEELTNRCSCAVRVEATQQQMDLGSISKTTTEDEGLCNTLKVGDIFRNQKVLELEILCQNELYQ